MPHTIESMLACTNGVRTVDGAYMSYLHHLVGAGIRLTPFKMGNSNPLDEDLTSLAVELQGRLSFEYKFLREKVVPISSFIGLTVVRECARNGHGAKVPPNFPDAPLKEHVVSYAFAKEPVRIIGIKPSDTINARGIGSATRTRIGTTPELENVVHLAITKELKQAIPPIQAVEAFPSKYRPRDPRVALHTISHDPETGPQYLEQIIPRSSINAE